MATTYEVEVLVEVTLDNDDLDGENEAFTAVDEIMQRAWDNDARYGALGTTPPWHFRMFEGAAARVDDTDDVVDSSSTDTTTKDET